MDKLTTQLRPADALASIENKCSQGTVAFLKSNYDNQVIRLISDQQNFKPTLMMMFLKIFTFSGVKGNMDELAFTDIIKFILSYSSDLTLEEIYKAFELERFGTLGARVEHYNLFGSVYVSTIIGKYRDWKKEQRTIHRIEKQIEAKTEMTESEKKEIIDQGIIRVFSEYKESREINGPCAHIYDELLDRGIIKGSTNPKLKDYYDTKMERARKVLLAELKIKQRDVSNISERKNIAQEIENLSTTISGKIILKTKKLVLIDFFDKLIREEIELKL